MPATDTTALDVIIPEVWDLAVLDARYAESQIMSRFLNKSEKVQNFGDIVHVPIEPVLTGGTVTAGTGAFTPETWTYTEAQITVNTWRHASIDVPDNANAFSHTDVTKRLPSAAGKLLAEQVDTDLAALHADWTTGPIGSTTDPVVFQDSLILQALFSLSNGKIPKSGLSWILSPEAFYLGLFTKDRWTSADQMGLPKSVLTTNFRFPIFGVPAYETPLLANVAGVRKCFVAHKEALATAISIDTKPETARRTSALILSTVVVVQNLYGVRTIRANHARVVNIKAEAT